MLLELLNSLLGSRAPNAPEDPAVDQLDAQFQLLLAEFRSDAPALRRDTQRVFHLIGQIPIDLKWREGLREELTAVLEAAIREAEQFGDHTGPKKRQYALDLSMRVLRRYNVDGLPFVPPVDDVLVRPVIGVLIDWSVAVLNVQKLWQPKQTIDFPNLYAGANGVLLRIGVRLWWFILGLKEILFRPSRYERLLRASMRRMDPEVKRLQCVLSPAVAQCAFLNVADLVVKIGNVTAPHVKLINRILLAGAAFEALDSDQRREMAFRVIRELTMTAFRDDPLATFFLDSPFGDAMLRAMVSQIDWILQRNGLLPRTQS